MTSVSKLKKLFRRALHKLRLRVEDDTSYNALFEVFTIGFWHGREQDSKNNLPLSAAEEKEIAKAIDEIRAEVDDDEVMH
jgi:hypothetical protein